MAAPVLAYEPVTCTPINKTRSIITSIDSADSFCTMLTGYGVKPVAPNEGCAGVYCHGPVKNGAQPMPPGYILSSNFVKNTSYVQVTGCLNSTVWAQDPFDDGGQMDSHGWPYSCQGWAKFVSLIEPRSNTYCIRCCDKDNNVDCDTSHSTKGCWTVVPGKYTMADGSVCQPPPGSADPISPTTSVNPLNPATPASSSSAAASASASASASSGSSHPATATIAGATGGTNAGSHLTTTIEMVGTLVVVALALSASL
ncbi:hypothetical protein BGZ94_002076 [Podila epigama]|nr:hypothetical protein BGZ94_002076 [Podila epigama]